MFLGFKTYLMRRHNKTQKYKGALFEQLESGWAKSRSVGDETEQKTRQQNKTHGSKQGKQIINQNIRVLTPLIFRAKQSWAMNAKSRVILRMCLIGNSRPTNSENEGLRRDGNTVPNQA